MNRKVDLSISCYGEVKDGRYDIVALPWGATEPHNLHFLILVPVGSFGQIYKIKRAKSIVSMFTFISFVLPI